MVVGRFVLLARNSLTPLAIATAATAFRKMSTKPDQAHRKLSLLVRYLVGFGNYTARDDSIGVRIVEHISEHGPARDPVAASLASSR